jgi:hypothetical protein
VQAARDGAAHEAAADERDVHGVACLGTIVESPVEDHHST